MDPKKIVKLEKILETYVKGHLDLGGKLVPNLLNYETDGISCCVLGTVYRFYSNNIFDIEKDLSEFLECDFTSNDFWSFTDGFDGIIDPRKRIGKDSVLYQLGMKFRHKYLNVQL